MSQPTINRRELLTAGAAAGVMVATGLSRTAVAQETRLPGIQLYTVRGSMATDVEVTLQAIAGIGYREVEFAGYFDHSAKQIRDLLRRYDLTSPSTHVNAEVVRDDPAKFAELAAEIGHDYVTIAWIQEENRRTIDDYKRWAATFNQLGEACRSRGMRVAYHNHDFEFQALRGEVPFDVLLRETDAQLIDFELDFFWVRKGNESIRKVLAKAPERMAMSHIKDINGSGDMVRVGEGIIDFATILADPVAASIKHCFVEHDHPQDPFRSAAYSFYSLQSILG